MELGSSTRIWISDSRDADLADAAERARVTEERVGEGRGGGAAGSLLARLRRRPALPARVVTR